MHHALIVCGRVFAGVVGALAFYLAFFLYEDEQGDLQNRIEKLWIKVYDRAKITDSTTTALMNKIAEYIRIFFDKMFGKRILSSQAITNTINLSIGGGFFSLIIYTIVDDLRNFSWRDLSAGDAPLTVLTSLACFALVILQMYVPRLWTFLISLIPPFYLIYSWGPSFFNGWGTIEEIPEELIADPILQILVASLLSDIIVIVVIRQTLKFVSRSFSFGRVTAAMTALVVCSFLVLVGPSLLTRWLSLHTTLLDRFETEYVYLGLSCMNATSALLCLLPALMLLIVLLHKLIWPLLSRLLYPVASRSFIKNRVALLSSGSTCMGIAFNLEHVGIKELLKLIS